MIEYIQENISQEISTDRFLKALMLCHASQARDSNTIKNSFTYISRYREERAALAFAHLSGYTFTPWLSTSK